MLKKRCLILALFGYASLSAAEKIDLSFSQPPQAVDKADFSLKWRPEAAPEKARFPESWQEKPPAPHQIQRHPVPSLFDRVHRSDRLRITDPDFSSFNSDGGYKPY